MAGAGRAGPAGELFVTADVAAGHTTRIWVDQVGR